jgi:hypothetical protein
VAPWSAARSHMSLLLDLDHLPVRLHFPAFQRAEPAHLGRLVVVLVITAKSGAIQGQERTATVAVPPSRPVSACYQARWQMRAGIAHTAFLLARMTWIQHRCRRRLRGLLARRRVAGERRRVRGAQQRCCGGQSTPCRRRADLRRRTRACRGHRERLVDEVDEGAFEDGFARGKKQRVCTRRNVHLSTS